MNRSRSLFPRRACIFATLITLLFSMQAVAASDSHCSKIEDADYRAMCKATASKRSFHCGTIKNQNMRSVCRAQLDKSALHCKSTNYESDYIEVDEALMAACKALAKSY